MQNDKLLPCPFCGGEAGLHEDYNGYHLVQCSKCGIGTLHRYIKEDAIKNWNTRKPMERILEQLEEERTDIGSKTGYHKGITKAIEIVRNGGKE